MLYKQNNFLLCNNNRTRVPEASTNVFYTTQVELLRRREVSNDLTEHSRFRSQALMWAFMIVAACLSHVLFFLEDKTPCSCRPQDVNGIACRTGVIVFLFCAFCKLARRRAQSMRPARSTSYSPGVGGSYCTTDWALKQLSCSTG